MTDKEKALRQIIDDFENNRLEADVALERIRELTGETIDKAYLTEYWASETLDTFVAKLLVEHIDDWHAIDDARARALIDEIKDNIDDDALIVRNAEALERRYGKPQGTVADMIFHRDMQDTLDIVKELQKDTRILL